MDPELLKTAALSADPALASSTSDLLLQAAIAEHRPDLWADLARNPGTYDGLRDWLALQGVVAGAVSTGPGQSPAEAATAPAGQAGDWATQQMSVLPAQQVASLPSVVGPVPLDGQPTVDAADTVPSLAVQDLTAEMAPDNEVPATPVLTPVAEGPGSFDPAAWDLAVASTSVPVLPASAGTEAARPPSGKRGKILAVLAVLVVAVAGGVGVGALVIRSQDGAGSTTAESGHDSGDRSKDGSGSGSSPGSRASASERATAAKAAPTSVTRCDTDPTMVPTSVSGDASSLSVVMTVTSSCPDGDLLSGSSNQVTVYGPTGADGSGGADAVVASGSFDMSGAPVAVSASGTSVTFKFGSGQYYRPFDELKASAMKAQVTADRQSGAASAAPSSLSGAGTLTATSGLPSADQESAAGSALTWQASHDAITATSKLSGKWVPQLSSKKPGLEADGITYDNQSTLAHFLRSRSKHSDAMLLYSDSWPVFAADGHWWVTIVGIGYDSPEGANQWCDSQGIGKDDCFAKYIDPHGTPEGTTRMR